MKYLVTGGAGFIGSHLVDKLIEDNHVICVDDLSSGYLVNLPKNKKLQIINKKFQDINISDFNNIDGIFHLASQVSVQKSIDDFYNSSCNNMTLTFKVWSLAKKYNIPVVYASSSAIYGNLEMGDELKNSVWKNMQNYIMNYIKFHQLDYVFLMFMGTDKILQVHTPV